MDAHEPRLDVHAKFQEVLEDRVFEEIRRMDA